MQVASEPHYAQVNGIRIAYDRTGDGFPLVALHGFPRDRRVWRKLTPLITSRFSRHRCPTDGDMATRTARRILLRMTTQPWCRTCSTWSRRSAFASSSCSGTTRARRRRSAWRSNHPDRVRGLVVLDAAPAGVRATTPRDPSGRTWYFDFFRQRGVAEQIIGQNPRLFFSLFLDRNPHLTPEEHEYFLETFYRPGSVDAVLADYRVGLEDDAERWRKDAADRRQSPRSRLRPLGRARPVGERDRPRALAGDGG